MNIFLCHNGQQSREVAKALYHFLQQVLQRANVFFSEDSIPKGTTWLQELTEKLESTSTGILCLTPANVSSPWINFEAGALFKGSGKSRIHGYLFNLQEADVKEPLSIFQNTKATKEDTLKLVTQLNNDFKEQAINNSAFNGLFMKCWPELEGALKKIPEGPVSESSVQRSDREILEEILSLVRRNEFSETSRKALGDIFLPNVSKTLTPIDYSLGSIMGSSFDKWLEEKGLGPEKGSKRRRKGQTKAE